MRGHRMPGLLRAYNMWSVQASDALAALRTLLLNEGWDTY
jgi:hypothetical protein